MKAGYWRTLIGSIAVLSSIPLMGDQGHGALQTNGASTPEGYIPPPPQSMLLETLYTDPDFGFDLSIDALFWQQMSNAMVFGTKGPTSVLSVSERGGDWLYPIYNIDWGFRVGLGFMFPDGCWEVDALYTRIRFRGSMTSSAAAGEAMADALTNIDAVVQPTYIHNHSTFHYDNLDIVMKRAYKLAKYLSVEPMFGFEAQWLRSKQTNTDTGGNLETLFGASQYDVYLKDRQWSVGAITGIHTLWDLWWGFTVIGDVDIALTTGMNKFHEIESTPLNPTVVSINSHNHHNQLHTQTFFGLGWTTTFNESITFGAKAGWEAIILTNALFTPGVHDFQAQGGTVGLWALF